MKRLTVIAVLALMILSVLLLSGCGEDEVYYTVSFDADGGSSVPEQSVLDGKKVTKPTDPTKPGYIFDGWFIGNEEWSFDSDVVTADITVKASWAECTEHLYNETTETCEKCGAAMPRYTVTFDADGGSSVSEQSVLDGKRVTKPTDPTKPGYIFDGWFIGDEEWSFDSDVVTTDITVKAAWVECTEHVDENFDGVCDACLTVDPEAGFVIYYPWETQTIIFQLSENTNNGELSSGCCRYLAGEDSKYTKPIDTSIKHRNDLATSETGIDPVYLYWDDSAYYGMTQCVTHIGQLIASKTVKNAPDVYVNFMYDMVGCAVKGYFANLKGTSKGEGNLAGLNYFEFNSESYDPTVNDRGYMYEWMQSLSLSEHKMYILGSDYFTDIMRAAYVIPVGIDLLESYGGDITGDRNKDGVFSVDDFYEQVYAGEWTYDVLMDYANAVKMDDNNPVTTDCWVGDERVGFAMSASLLAKSGLIYSSTVSFIEKEWNYEKNDWDYYYPDRNIALENFSAAVQSLLSAPGVAYVKKVADGDYDISQWGSGAYAHSNAIRARFSTGNILFGNIVLVGSLESAEYQSMREGSDFGVVVVPLYDKDAGYKDGAPYLTAIHNVARPGAISKNTTKFVECTAYLNYQSTHSTEILDEYYKYELMYNVVNSAESTIGMLKYAHANIRTSFDSAMEDAMVVVCDSNINDYKILTFVPRDDFFVEDMRGVYSRVVDPKRSCFQEVVDYFEKRTEE